MNRMTNQVFLREVTEDDLPIFFAQQDDPEANRMAAFPARGREAFDAHWNRILRDRTVTTRTIIYAGRVAGNIVSFSMFDEREVGYWIGREFWGRGIATRALQAFLKLETMRPLYAHTAKHNVGSQRVLKKCGFAVIGEENYTDEAGLEVEEIVFKLEEGLI